MRIDKFHVYFLTVIVVVFVIVNKPMKEVFLCDINDFEEINQFSRSLTCSHAGEGFRSYYSI
jgi:hypothetical protein